MSNTRVHSCKTVCERGFALGGKEMGWLSPVTWSHPNKALRNSVIRNRIKTKWAIRTQTKPKRHPVFDHGTQREKVFTSLKRKQRNFLSVFKINILPGSLKVVLQLGTSSPCLHSRRSDAFWFKLTWTFFGPQRVAWVAWGWYPFYVTGGGFGVRGEHFQLDRAVLPAARGCINQDRQPPALFSGKLFPLPDVLPIRNVCSVVLFRGWAQKPNPSLPLPSRLRDVLAHFLP